MNRPATASLHSATPKKNVPCFLDVVVVEFLLKKERVFFFRGSALQVFGQVAERNTDSVLRSNFAGEMIRKTSANSFFARFSFRRAGGCGRNARRILFWRDGKAKKTKTFL